jgi:hypothetical protein
MGEVAAIYDGGDVIDMSDVQSYHEVIREAFGVYFEREKIRHGLWKKYQAKDQVRQIRIKSDRAEHTLELLPSNLVGSLTTEDTEKLADATVEELYDIINYAVFAVQQLKGMA